MNTQIETDKDEAVRPLTYRERVGIQLLLVIFRMVYPFKYEHQVKAALTPLYELLEKK